MNQRSTFRFHGGPSQSRTSRISTEAWGKHEATIRALFPSSTLREMMDIMETQHGFKATEKQYIYQLPKWGLYKRAVKQGVPTGQSPAEGSPERDAPQPTGSGGQGGGGRDSPPSPLTSTPGTQTQYSLSPQYDSFQTTADRRLDLYRPVVGGKRSRSIVSSASRVSGTSAREGHKRVKVCPESLAASPSAQETTDFTTSPSVSPLTQSNNSIHWLDDHMDRAFGIESPYSPGTTTTVRTSTGMPQDRPETPSTAVPDTPKDTQLPHTGPPLEPDFNDWTTPELHEALETAAKQVFQKTLSGEALIRVSKRHQLMVRLSRLAETLVRRGAAAWTGAKDTTRALRDVADYLQAFGLRTDAFYLYAFLLSGAEEEKQQQQPEPAVHLKDAAGPPPWSLNSLHLACAAAAGTPEQCAMVRKWPASAPPGAFYGYQRLLQHGVFADMYGRAELRAEAAHEAAEARRLLASACTFSTTCVAGVRFGRNADLMAYSYLLRFGKDAVPATFAGYDRFIHRVWEAPVHGTGASDADDCRDPLADLRSVLRWCFRAVDPTAATDGEDIFSTFSEIDEANSAVAPTPDGPGTAALDPRALGLFHCLFDRWIQLRDSAPMLPPIWHDSDGKEGEVWLWTQTLERMGLAPTEFLAVLCEMITEAGGGGGGDGVVSERSPVSYTAFIEKLDALDALPATALADLFLAHYCERQTLSHRIDLSEDSPPSPTPSVRPDDDNSAAVSASSNPTTPSASAATAHDPDDDDARSRSVRSAVAPSYASSDMSSLRRMALRARHLVRSPAFAAATQEPPSHLLRRPSLTVSELSERFGESMSIGSSRASLMAPRSRHRYSGTGDEGRPRGG